MGGGGWRRGWGEDGEGGRGRMAKWGGEEIEEGTFKSSRELDVSVILVASSNTPWTRTCW